MVDRDFLRRAFLTLGFFLLAAPAFLLCGAALSPDRAALWLLPLACALALSSLARLLPARLRFGGVIAAALLSALAALRLGGALEAGGRAWFAAVLAAAAAASHMGLLARPREDALSVYLWYTGIAVYIAARFLSAVLPLPASQPPLRACALSYFAYVILALALRSLWDGMGGGRAPSRRMLMRNIAAAAGLALLFLLLSNLPQVQRALRRALAALRDGLLWLLSLIRLSGTGADSGGMGAMDLSMFARELSEPSAFELLLEKLLRIAAACLSVALALFLLFLSLRGLCRALRALWRRLRAYAAAVTDAYEDKVESLLDWSDVQRALQTRRERAARQREARVPWDRLTPRQRVRRCYQVYLSRHPEAPERITARQLIGRGPLSDIYEAARYSSREIAPEEAEAMRSLQRKQPDHIP